MIPFEESQILFEDNHVIVVNKKAGQIIQGDKTGDEPLSELIKAFLKKKYDKPGNVFCGVVHRLDRPTSGTVIFAKTSKALSRLNEQFRNQETNKIYWAICEEKPSENEGRLVAYLKKNEKQNKSYVVNEQSPGAKKAILNYKILHSSDKYHLLEITLETGRHHQIRTQLAHMGCIIKGDVKYDAKRSNKDLSISLHSRALTFTHPTQGNEINLTAACPEDALWQYFEDKLKV